MKILIGYNGTEFARAAIDDLAGAGLPASVEAHILTVAEICFPTVRTEDVQSVSIEGVARVKELFPEWTIAASTAIRPPVREISSEAQRLGVDLIVLGEPNRKDRGGNVFLGPVSQGLLTQSNIPLRISRRKDKRSGPSLRLLLGFDGSEGSERAVAAVASRSWPKGTLVRVISIEGPGVVGALGRLSPQLRAAAVGSGFESKWAETLAEHAMHELDAAGIRTELEIRGGSPQKALVEAADEWDADCIFLAPHCDGNSYERFLLGSVSAAVAAHANCTVEIVR